jgi:hypothetical protein
VAAALISGISAGFLEAAKSTPKEQRAPIHFNFAFDENVFEIAYRQLRAGTVCKKDSPLAFSPQAEVAPG